MAKAVDQVKKAEKKHLEATESIKHFDERTKDLEDKKSKMESAENSMPDELPDDIRNSIENIFEQKKDELSKEAKELADNVYDAQAQADSAFAEARELGEKFKQDSVKLEGARSIPLVGSFLEQKGKELGDRSVELFNVAKDTQTASDNLAFIRNRLTSI